MVGSPSYYRGRTFPLICFWMTGFLDLQIVDMSILIPKKIRLVYLGHGIIPRDEM